MSQLPTVENTLVVVVTYSERQKLVRETIDAVCDMGFTRIVLVDNASPLSTSLELISIANESEGRISIIRHQENRGSAGGIRSGLLASLEAANISYVWLLDDDNKPRRDAFEKLVSAFDYLGRDQMIGLVSLRESRREYGNAALYGDFVGISAGSFLGFDVQRSISRALRNKFKKIDVVEYRYPIIRIGYAPYGGFFFSKSILEHVGLPREKFFLYSDDHEFSMRWYDCDGSIYLCAKSKIDELEQSWGGEEVNRVPFIMNSKSDESKLYYFMRNRFYLESRDKQKRMRFWLNALIYLASMSIISLIKDFKPRLVISRLKLIYKSYREGSRGGFLE